MRELVPVFAVAVNATEPLPVPDAPAVTVSHVTLLVAVHVQPAPTVTAAVPEPPDEGIVALAGEMDAVHDSPA